MKGRDLLFSSAEPIASRGSDQSVGFISKNRKHILSMMLWATLVGCNGGSGNESTTSVENLAQ